MFQITIKESILQVQLKRPTINFIKFFGEESCTHINSLDEFFEPKEVKKRRDLLTNVASMIGRISTNQIQIQFNMGLVINWSSMKAQNLSLKDCPTEIPSSIRLFGFLKSSVELSKYNIRKHQVLTARNIKAACQYHNKQSKA